MLNYTTLAFKSTKYNKYLKEQAIDLFDRTFIMPDNFDFDLIEITEEYIARPDLISKILYGDEIYTDVICKLNGISNPFELNEGDLLIVPSADDVMMFAHKPSTAELQYDATETNENTPKPKTKNQKRKANEAVVGDSRFKIDPNKRVIIY